MHYFASYRDSHARWNEDSIAGVKSSKKNIVKVKASRNGITITPKKAGKTTVTVTTAKGATVQIAVVVKNDSSLNESLIIFLSFRRTRWRNR